MTFDQFITKYNGQKIDFDGQYGAQCVDLFRFYCQEVLGITQVAGVIGAYQLFDLWPYTKEKNTPLGLPAKGDMMIWTQAYGGNGHVGVVTTASLLKFEAFEQNDPLGSPCHLQTYGYRNVIGWLKPPVKLAQTQNYKGELRIIPNELRAKDEQTWETLCKVYGVDPKNIDETIN